MARNVSWLVVFNAAYLGVFAFAPFAVGRAVEGASRVLGHSSDVDVLNKRKSIRLERGRRKWSDSWLLA